MPAADAETTVLSRESLPALTRRVLRPASGAKPAILLARSAGRLVVVKDFSANAWPLRHLYGRWLVGRESSVYARLDGVPGVPAFRGRLDAFAFAVDFVGGATLKDLPHGSVPRDVFDQLAALHSAIHARGVVHLDSHQRKNILLTRDGRVHLVDFATSLYVGRGWLASRVLVPLLGWADRLGRHKLTVRYCAEPPGEPPTWRSWLVWGIESLWPPTAVRRLLRWARGRTRADASGSQRPRRSDG